MKRADRGAGGDLKATNKQKEKATPAVRQSKRRVAVVGEKTEGFKKAISGDEVQAFPWYVPSTVA